MSAVVQARREGVDEGKVCGQRRAALCTLTQGGARSLAEIKRSASNLPSGLLERLASGSSGSLEKLGGSLASLASLASGGSGSGGGGGGAGAGARDGGAASPASSSASNTTRNKPPSSSDLRTLL